jgi:hypothetical protein
MTTCTEKELHFSVFMLHKLAEHWGESVPDTYRILMDTDILDSYILESYDTLHSLSTEYLIEDITEFAREKGAHI